MFDFLISDTAFFLAAAILGVAAIVHFVKLDLYADYYDQKGVSPDGYRSSKKSRQ